MTTDATPSLLDVPVAPRLAPAGCPSSRTSFQATPRSANPPKGVTLIRVASTLVAIAIAIAVGVLAPAALSEVPPLKHVAYLKLVAAYKKQAREHGVVKVSCTAWDPSGLRGQVCELGTRGRVYITPNADPCSWGVLVFFYQPRFPRTEHDGIVSCGQRWWEKPMPAPWTYPATG